MFSNSTHVNTVPLYLNSVPSNAPPSYVYAQPSVVNQVGPPELSPAAHLLARTYENQALVFRDEQGQERVYCSICCEYGSGSSSRGYGYHSPDGSRNITVPAYEAHRGTKYHAKAVIAKEKGKQPLEPAVTAPEPVFGATSEQGSVTAVTVEVSLLQQLVTLMEKVVTSVEEIKAMLNEKQTREYSQVKANHHIKPHIKANHGREKKLIFGGSERHIKDGNIGRQKLGPWNINFQMAHFSEGDSFDFQKYIKRALEKDFEVAVASGFGCSLCSSYSSMHTTRRSLLLVRSPQIPPPPHAPPLVSELVSTGILRMVLGEYQTSDPLSVFRV
ncbi:hypothetical protein SASPL_121422 [Salvia splendens]|uniref:C17orf113 probable zinc finger domain-containing protein n=1 Tax=Salvia splendens TaxID=180675 RepID=A0A8X8XXA1_SALSN|nr:hypothetical protein SASPL_121422 [Salvia splendens]